MSVETFGGRESLGEYSAILLDNVQAAGSGEWYSCSSIKSATLHVRGLAVGDSITVHHSNELDENLDTSDDEATAQTITGDNSAQIVVLTKLPANSIKVKKVGSVAAATVTFHGLNR